MKKSLLMKTMLLLFALVTGSTCAWATDAVLPKTQALTTSFEYVGTDTHIQIKTSSANDYTSPLRFYANNTVTIKADDGYVITSVTYEASSTGNYVTNAQNATVTPNVTPTVSGKNVTWTLNNVTEFTFTPSAQTRANSITISYTTGSATPTCATPTFSPAAGLYNTAQNVTISTTTEGATIYYTKDGSTPTTSSTPYTGAIAVSSTTTIKAIAVKASYDNSAVATATYTIIEHAGTEADPYTVADAVAYIGTLGSETSATDVYVQGIISQIDSYNKSYNSITYWISDDGTTTGQMEVYSGKGLNGADFSGASDLVTGANVVVKGKVKKYGDVYEFDKNNQLVSYDVPVHPTISAAPASLTGFTYAEGQGPSTAKTFSVSGSNMTANISLTASANYEISLAENSGYASNLALTQTEGAVAATTIYVRLKAGLTKEDYDGTITLTSTGAENVVVSLTGNVTRDFAILPFTFNAGKSSIANTDGLTQDGLGSDYSSAPKLKFDNSDDYLILKFNEAPVSLSFDIKGNSFADGTFTVQTSADGETYTDLKAYTELGNTMNESFVLASTVRYIKWVYTEKVDGNVALGNIKVSKDANDVVAVTVSAAGLATFASDSKLDFGNVTNLEAYIAKENKGKIELVQVNKVAAGTGVLLRALNSATEFKVPVTAATAEATTGNLFVRGAGAAVASSEGGKYNYVLGKHNGEVGFYKAGGMTVATDKAYIQTSISSARIAIDFDEMDVTGVNEVKTTNRTNEFFNLAGQRVAQPTKGLYIVNGRKVIIK